MVLVMRRWRKKRTKTGRRKRTVAFFAEEEAEQLSDSRIVRIQYS